MKVFPSTSVSVAPRPSRATTGRYRDSGPATTRSLRSAISRDRGPGIAVLRSIARVVAMLLTIAEAPANATVHRIGAVVLSDRTIARLLSEGRIEIDPYDETLLQPSSVDVRVDRLFRVFHNNRYPYIDV